MVNYIMKIEVTLRTFLMPQGYTGIYGKNFSGEITPISAEISWKLDRKSIQASVTRAII